MPKPRVHMKMKQEEGERERNQQGWSACKKGGREGITTVKSTSKARCAVRVRISNETENTPSTITGPKGSRARSNNLPSNKPFIETYAPDKIVPQSVNACDSDNA